MKNEFEVHTFGFEGAHRSGKGTQIELLRSKIESLGIPCIVVRGGGRRGNSGEQPGDPYSEWWAEKLPVLRGEGAKKEDWFDGSKRLARELVVFRDRILPRYAAEKGSSRAVLLIDRSILSHMAMSDLDLIDADNIEAVYGTRDDNGRKLPKTREVFPDLIFYLKAEKDALLARLDARDPLFDFKKKNITETTAAFDESVLKLPPDLQERVVAVDAARSQKEIGDDIYKIIQERVAPTMDDEAR